MRAGAVVTLIHSGAGCAGLSRWVPKLPSWSAAKPMLFASAFCTGCRFAHASPTCQAMHKGRGQYLQQGSVYIRMNIHAMLPIVGLSSLTLHAYRYVAHTNDMIVEAWDPALWIRYIHDTEGTLNPQTHLSVTMAALVTDPTSLVFVSGVGFSDPIYTHRGLASLILHAYREHTLAVVRTCTSGATGGITPKCNRPESRVLGRRNTSEWKWATMDTMTFGSSTWLC